MSSRLLEPTHLTDGADLDCGRASVTCFCSVASCTTPAASQAGKTVATGVLCRGRWFTPEQLEQLRKTATANFAK